MHHFPGTAGRHDSGWTAEIKKHYGSPVHGGGTDQDLAAGLQGAIVKEDGKDGKAWEEYLENIMKKRGSKWLSLYEECKELNH